jgi:hypothetical protein
MLVLEMTMVDLQKPVILPLLLTIPVSSLSAWFHHLPTPDFLFLVGRSGFFGSLLLQNQLSLVSPIIHKTLDFVFLVMLVEDIGEGIHPIRELHIRWSEFINN